MLLALAVATSPHPPPPSPLERGAPAAGVVMIRGGAWSGTGVIWDARSRHVLTALHVVEEMPMDAIRVTVTGGPRSLVARVVDTAPQLDLALLEVDGALEPEPALRDAATLSPGDVISLASCPAMRCDQRDGQVISTSRALGGARYLTLSTQARPGASGGAIFDAHGAVVGIMDLTLLHEPGIALAIPIEHAAARFPRE